MKEIFINDLSNYLNQEITSTFLVNDITESINRFANQWQDVIVSDATGTTTLRVWAENMSDEYLTYCGQVVEVLGKVTLYQSRPCIEVVYMKPKESHTYQWDDYVVQLDKMQRDILITMLKENIKIAKEADESIGMLLDAVFTENRLDNMSKTPGGVKHHCYYGGLLEHTVDVCEIAKQIMIAYETAMLRKPYKSVINKANVIAGALLHDVGYLNYFNGFPNVTRSSRGWLVDVKTDSVLFVTMFNNMVKNRVKDLAPINHIILTANSVREDQLQPRTIEALIVNKANMQSCDIDGFDTTFFEQDRLCVKEKNYVFSKKTKHTLIRPGKESKIK